jgi:hypothetical protein
MEEKPPLISGQPFSSICRERHRHHPDHSLIHYAANGIMDLMPRAGLCRIDF